MSRPRRRFGDRADLQIPIGSVNYAQLTELIRRGDVFTQIFVSY